MNDARRERRRHRRWHVEGLAATVVTEDTVAHYGVENVSASGALLTAGPVLAVGQRLELAVRLGGRPLARVEGRVVRVEHGPRGTAFGVHFDRADPDCEDALQDAAVSELERRRAPAVLVVARAPALRHRIAAALGELGRRVFTAATPLEAMAVLVGKRGAVAEVMVELELTSTGGLELAHVIAEMEPAVRRILISERARPAQLELARRAGIVHATVCMPCRPDDLRASLAPLEPARA